MERTPEQIIGNEPFTVQFGDRKFKIKRLPISKAKAWRQQVMDHDSGVATQFSQTDFQERLKALNDAGPDLILDLVESFIKAQSGDKVSREQLEEATDEQLLGAYKQLLEVTFPNALDAGTTILRQVLTT